MRQLPGTERLRYGRQNLLFVMAQMLCWGLLIEVLHRLPFGPLWWLLALLFVLMMQGVFSMMHDAIHHNGHPAPRLNEAIGIVTAAIFGTTYTLFRVNHEGHHVRNRTRAEVAEYFYPDDNRFLKTLKYYVAILGDIWFASFLALFILPWLPYRWANRLARPSSSMDGYAQSFKAYHAADWRRQRRECVGVVLFWVAVGTRRLALADAGPLALVYLLFAFGWSSLQ